MPTAERPAGLKEAYPTKDGRLVHVTPVGIEHLRAHPSIIPLLDEAMASVTLPSDGSKYLGEIDLGRPLEKTTRLVVPDIGMDGEGLFAFRKGRMAATRVTFEQAQNTDMVSTVVIIASPPVGVPDKYILRTAYIGKPSPMEPWAGAFSSEQEREQAEHFWQTHALVYDPAAMEAPFTSTWREVIAQAKQAFAEKAAADVKKKARGTI